LGWRLTHQPRRPKYGQAAPSFTLPLLNRSGSLSLRSLRGNPVVINFWSSTCVPCKAEATSLERLYDSHRSSGLLVVGIDPEDFKSDARRFIAEHHVTYPNVADAGENVATRYGIDGTPETFLVDRRGRVIQILIGPINAAANKQPLAAALRQITRD
jgi:cytochrome c biogenesis protein CcmG/thiol:disulfide interchange protein DsbE